MVQQRLGRLRCLAQISVFKVCVASQRLTNDLHALYLVSAIVYRIQSSAHHIPDVRQSSAGPKHNDSIPRTMTQDYTPPPSLSPLEDQVLHEYRRLNSNLDTVRVFMQSLF